MAGKYWLKLYHEMIDDPKVARLPDSSYRRFIECLLLAGELDEGGLLPPIPDMAWRLRIDETSLTQDMSRLAMAELVELTENGRWLVSAFENRQKGLSKAEYMKRLRDERRVAYEESQEGVTNGNGTGNETVTKSVTNSKTDKIREDKDIDKTRKEPKATLTLPPNLNTPKFEKTWNDWKQYKGKSIKTMTYEKQLRDASLACNAHGVDAVVDCFEKSMRNGWKGVFFDKLGNGNGRSLVKPQVSAPVRGEF